MTIEISNKGISGQPPKRDDDNNAIKNSVNNQDAGSNKDSSAGSLNITSTARELQTLQDSIANLPVVDSKKVQAAAEKIEQRELGIMSNNMEERLKSAEDIVSKMLGMEQDLPN